MHDSCESLFNSEPSVVNSVCVFPHSVSLCAVWSAGDVAFPTRELHRCHWDFLQAADTHSTRFDVDIF